MVIRAVRGPELPVLQRIEVAAGRAFIDVGMAAIAGDEPLSRQELDGYRQAGLNWVAVDESDAPVAYLIAKPVDGNLHIEQVSVHPGHSRRGIGRELIEHADAHAAVVGLPALTLTTFVDVPWNAPYYARLGFRFMSDDEVTPGLRAIRDHEVSLGLDRWPRTCMYRAVRPR